MAAQAMAVSRNGSSVARATPARWHSALLALIAARAGRMLAAVLVQAALAELLLGVVGIADHRWEQLAADVVLVAVFLLGARPGCSAGRPGGGRDPGHARK